MGVDTCLAVPKPATYTDADMQRWRFELASFFDEHCSHPDDGGYERLPIAEGRDALTINTTERYYGVGYERGNWPKIRMMILWAIKNFGACFYWPDHGEQSNPITADGIAALDAHFLSNGRNPYAYRPRHDAPICKCLGVQVGECGGGGDQTFWTCAACGSRYVSWRGGSRRFPRDKDLFAAADECRKERKGAP